MEETGSRKIRRIIGVVFVLLYAGATALAIYYAVTCGPGLCALAGVVPFTPWPQLLEGLLGLDLPRISLAIAFLINAAVFYYLGSGFVRLWQYVTSEEDEQRYVKL